MTLLMMMRRKAAETRWPGDESGPCVRDHRPEPMILRRPLGWNG
jgi:hypothetical protein